MAIDVTVQVGGEAGQGIQTIGDLLAQVCTKAGFFMMMVNDFESRIRGGHSFIQIRISDQPILAPSSEVNLLVALNRSIYDIHHNEVSDNGLIIVDDKELNDSGTLIVPIKEMAREAGGKIMANTVAAGAILSVLGAPFEYFEELLQKKFAKKSEIIVKNNVTAARLGFDSAKSGPDILKMNWDQGQPKGVTINGSKAVALGALAADCRFAAFYPMSPATSVITNMIALSDDLPFVTEQAEDEIAAGNMILGSAFAGVRSITSTSGGGFCLMTEALGLAGITETPMVVVNAQRPGPATGLPTRTAQPDLLFSIHASQDDFPRFIFAPGTPNEAYDITIRAFDLADKYQVPVIILMDQYLNDSLYLTDGPMKLPEKIERYLTTSDQLENPGQYQRYAITESGISPRILPSNGDALIVVSGNEHTEDGHISEDKENRVRMVDKRQAKFKNMVQELNAPTADHEDCDVLLVGWGSTKGALLEAVDLLRQDQIDAGYLHYTDMWPFPSESAKDMLKKAKRFIMVEQNSTAQFGQLIRYQTGLSYQKAILKYDGRPFFPDEIVNAVKNEME